MNNWYDNLEEIVSGIVAFSIAYLIPLYISPQPALSSSMFIHGIMNNITVNDIGVSAIDDHVTYGVTSNHYEI